MKVLFINNDGGGFCDTIDVPDGTTVDQLFRDKLPDRQARDYLIRVDRQPVAAGHVLTPGSRVSITPTKIAGALAVAVGAAGAARACSVRRALAA